MQFTEANLQKRLKILFENIVLLPHHLLRPFLSLFLLVGAIVDGRGLTVKDDFSRPPSFLRHDIFSISDGKVVLFGGFFGEILGWWHILLRFLGLRLLVGLNVLLFLILLLLFELSLLSNIFDALDNFRIDLVETKRFLA